MKLLLLLVLAVQGLVRNTTKKKSMRQMVDEAYRFTQDEDMTFSAEQMSEDDLLLKLFPGLKIIFHRVRNKS